MDQEFKALIIFIIIAMAWCWLWDMVASPSDPPESSKPRLNARRLERHSRSHPHGHVREKLRADMKPRDGHVPCDLRLIRLVDPSFDIEQFLVASGIVYETVVGAFTNADRELMQDLLSKEVFEAFSDVLAMREDRGEQVEFEFIWLRNSRITDVCIFGGRVEITVHFEAELATARRTRSTERAESMQIVDVSDLWTFARELRSSTPDWKVTGTQPA